MYDSVATFYGGYDHVDYLHRTKVRIPLGIVAIALSGTVLLGFVAADVSAYDAAADSVQVTGVNWYVLGQLEMTTGGFTLHPSQSTLFTLECDGVCWNIDGATVSAPFLVAGLTIVDHPVQYVNLTIRAPAYAYRGEMTVTLTVV